MSIGRSLYGYVYWHEGLQGLKDEDENLKISHGFFSAYFPQNLKTFGTNFPAISRKSFAKKLFLYI